MTSNLIGVSAALGSTISWAFGAFLFKKLGEKADSTDMTLVKTTISFFILWSISLIFGYNFSLNNQDLIFIAISGILGIAVGDSLFFAALKNLSPVVVSIILLAGPDVLNGILGVLVLKEFPSTLEWLGVILILTGLFTYIFPVKKEDNDAKTTIKGLFFAFLSLLATSASVVFIKPILIHSNTLVVTMYRMFFSSLFLLFFLLFFKKKMSSPFFNLKYGIKFTSVVFIITIGGFWLSLVAMKNCDIVLASSIMTLEPLLIFIYMVIFCQYKASIREYLALFTALSGVLLIALQ